VTATPPDELSMSGSPYRRLRIMERGTWKRSVLPGRSPGPRRAVVLCAALASLAIAAPADAGGRNDVYSGSIEQDPVPGFPHETKIELYVHTQHHRRGRTTVKITHINVYDITLRCENGSYLGSGENRGNTDTIQVVPRYPIVLNRGSFDEPRASGATGELVPIKGSLTAHGAAGTLSVSDDVGTVGSEEPGEPTEHFGTCRSGPLSWSATRGG
jgi:hypothetical protein